MRKTNYNHLIKQFCILLFAFCIFCAFGTVSASAAAANSVSYVDYTWSEESKTLSSETKSVDTYTEITSTTTEMTSGWYVVNGEVTVAERMTVTGEVHLILADGAHLTASLGITVNEGNSLYIYGQSSDENTMGKLTATTTNSDAAIGSLQFHHAGTIVINGGNINASADEYGAGIGSGEYRGGYQITINAGVVTATASRGSAAIGSGNNGGTAAVWGTVHSICINGGVVNATVTDNGGAAIGGGSSFDGGDITITGGTVTATNKGAGAAIGGGMYGSGGNITITGGNVSATYTHSFRNGAAIGAGYYGESAGNILITGGVVTAKSTLGCGIGVYSGDNGRIVILGGTVNASGSGNVHINAGASGSMMLVDGTTVTISGDFTLQTDFVLPEGYTLEISEGATLTIPEGVTLTLPEAYTLISNGTVNAVGAVNCITHKYVEGVCICGLECSHVGGTPTCMAPAVCTTCGTSYGEVDPTNHNWENGVCTYGCNTIHEPHDWSGKDGICTVCGATCTHTGGTATCQTQAVCEACGVSYGTVDTNNHDSSVECENGFCPNGCYEPAILNAAGYYEIDNAGQLFWFANHVNTVDRTASAVLVADIDLENRPWTPIGETDEAKNNFRGVFDGQNHTIKGLYVEGGRAGLGFFGEVKTGTVKNFTIYGEVIVNTEVDYVGGVIGSICGVNGETDLERNGAIIQNITSYVNLTANAHGVGMIGGFVGYANHQSLIENCSWYGTFDAGIYRVDDGAGGFIGKIQENTGEVTIRNCAAYGTIKTNYAGDYNNTATIYMGGFLSLSDTGAKTTLENCLFAGKFERGENLTDEAFLGAFGTLRSVNAIKNCYYLGDDGLEAVHSDSNLKPGSDNVEITSVTGAQLLSGEVAYKLGEHFGQILEGENRQSYPVLGETKVEDSQRFEIYGQQLNIGADLSMKYYVMGYAPAFNSGALYMEFIHNGVKTKVYAGEPNADGFYVFVLEGINPQCMGDSIYAKLYYNETEVASHGCEDGKEYSVEKNLLNLLEKYKDDAALVALINDTLAYGKAAEEYRGHTSIEGNYTGTNREIPVSEAQVADVITGYTVRFGTAISIIIEVDPSAFGNTIYKVVCNGTELRNFPSPNSPLYKVTNIAATDFDKEWEFVVRSPNPMGDVYGTVVVSVNDYLYAISQSTDASDEMKALAKALYNYGVSAEIYNHVANGVGEHTYTYIDNGDGTHDKVCTVCGDMVADNENHTIENHVCTACGTMEIVVSFDADDYEWKTGDELYFCRVSRDNQWEEYCFTATVAEDGTVTWTSDKTLYWDGTGEHRLFVSYPCTAVGWDDFMIPTDQSDVDKLKEADCMNARWIGTPTTNVIEFELKHRMAKIMVNYVIASQFDLDAPIIAEIYSNAMYCIFRDADGLPIITSVGQYDAWITPYHNANQFTVYVAPGEYNTDGMFKFYVGDAEVQIEITTPGAVTLEEGGEYTFDVKVGQDVFRIAEVSMGDIDSPFGDGWNSETDLKAIGTQAEGKTAWENGDQIIVTFTSPWFGTQYGTLTYDGNVGSWSTDVSFSYLEGEIPTVSAIYAPCYEVVDGNMQLKDGMQLGMTEYISAACSITDETLNISFEGATRNYSRLRIVGLANQTLTVITTGFTPAGATVEASESYTLTTDEDGNADLYGTFAEGATILVQLDETELAQYSFYESTVNGISYALDALDAQL